MNCSRRGRVAIRFTEHDETNKRQGRPADAETRRANQTADNSLRTSQNLYRRGPTDQHGRRDRIAQTPGHAGPIASVRSQTTRRKYRNHNGQPSITTVDLRRSTPKISAQAVDLRRSTPKIFGANAQLRSSSRRKRAFFPVGHLSKGSRGPVHAQGLIEIHHILQSGMEYCSTYVLSFQLASEWLKAKF